MINDSCTAILARTDHHGKFNANKTINKALWEPEPVTAKGIKCIKCNLQFRLLRVLVVTSEYLVFMVEHGESTSLENGKKKKYPFPLRPGCLDSSTFPEVSMILFLCFELC